MQPVTPSRIKKNRSRKVTSKRESPEERTYRLQYRRRVAKSLQTKVDGTKESADVLSPVQQQILPTNTVPAALRAFAPLPRIPSQAVTDRQIPSAMNAVNQKSPDHHIRWQFSMTSPLLALEPKTRRRILRYCLVSEYVIKPCCHIGSLEDILDLREGDAIDASLLQVSRLLYSEASEVLYGQNGFGISRPDVGNWWLKKIGKNVTKIRALRLDLSSGIANNLNVSSERLWLNLLTWLVPRHQIKCLYISFQGWQSLKPEEERYNSDAHAGEMALDARKEIMSLLTTFKKLQTVEIVGGDFLSPRKVDRLLKEMKF